ncbi:MAG: sensor domain-containing diguanylate cyclase [Candidatus Marinimicrobia bacterium]|jgi:diguanylate cyclase (GGDEF)-like protein|nr:sensor domain-containing diguanylate cyclase [Candidatus Neomarinimicrobiota bacterium]MBT4362137.1 sensor domain-containing diguanylate cyclase [Candidatus Neomarinimicrobiota bacterium]MBT4713660.1 sensor domain-containing diguanylate cyclase [Candidatus Neomarinimicrobiota bacterium]MBT4945192.1 sensor domain-containing diguanylate cyclase [Candidatus Neomarinimicrobiota bacterium]MBT5268802.1 sensor domain-containing diguanylate cyclase [Candidatus Neomarinimicrobiota bacterium]
MALTDIDLANMDTQPFFKSQIHHLFNILYTLYPDVNVYFYTKINSQGFDLQQIPANKAHLFDTIPADVPAIMEMTSAKEIKSKFIKNQENAAMFSTEPAEWAAYSVLSPLGESGGIVGFLLSIFPKEFDRDMINLEVFDEVAASITVNSLTSSLLESYKERSDHLSVMLEVNTHLNVAATKTDFLYEISRFGKYFIQFDRAVLVLHPENTPEYFMIDSIEGDETGLQQGMSYPVYNSLVSKTILTGHHFIYKKSNKPEPDGIYRTGDFQEYPYSQVIGFPLAKVKNGPGVLVLESSKEYPIKQSELGIFEMISQSLGAALTRFSLYERLNNYATIDTLTHLYNIRALKQRFEEELARAGRYQNSLVVLFLDLDKFKLVNDTYGHLVGDFVLKEISQIIRETIRTSDIPGRYGGEEFVVIMVNADAEACMASAKRICTAVREHQFEMNETNIENRISIGLSEFPRDGESMQDLIQSADAAMYTAKRRGGDQVVKYEKGMVPKSRA